MAKSLAIDPVQVVGVDVGSLESAGLAEIAAGTGGSIEPAVGNLTEVILDTLGDAASPPFAWPGGPYATSPGEPVSFDGSGSFDPDGTAIVEYEWDFDGDGVFDTSTASPKVQFTYDAAYAGPIVIRVTDGDSGLAEFDERSSQRPYKWTYLLR